MKLKDFAAKLWHYLLISIVIAGYGVFDLLMAVVCFTGTSVNDGSIYRMETGALDIIYGVCLLFFAVFAFYVAYLLIRHKENAPVMFTIMFLLDIIVGMLYYVFNPNTQTDAFFIFVIIAGIKLLLLKLYNVHFTKRAELYSEY